MDAALFTYALSIITDRPPAWQSAQAATRPGGRMAVVDLALPTGRWAVLAPAARLACLLGGVHLGRAPWRWVGRDLHDVKHRRHAPGMSASPPARSRRTLTQTAPH